ncbi:bifunctional DNA-formamidopyrimidine glycosylase/DNA-(apurinic or apyrimidinic site) lyase [Asticcacaulis sp. EMRT-3]|uniref:bifunctional DNA-formamidopyrimidine glycosylase/DNA-(apurinic or apyrimidinic site) lyase n=1 Tax=Asticcacaulis sp. EMRT-3 TaxID=3040349 RepID=UPI0024AF38CF|nr:bifunctional DNA-formamidopyrimidine glycosylase/DNA-(apurinic or apyrimidinic site) lyase [Asticcacaulis sp. EMRT-3]MDI7775661.1 bifunctional DNA-formamidopyrimidine glycosylase/DNA-(apurinic or apyrimidinic site) lyase [Asticcacaulis sp. EMRT-3]
MPELPEVETVRRGLAPVLEGAKLSDVRLFRAGLRYPFPTDFAERLNGASVVRLERRAKYLLAWLDTQAVWVTHLGMTGRFRVDETPVSNPYYQTAPDQKHLHVQLLASKDGHTARIDYFDPRRFGFMLLLSPDELYASKWFQGLGVEPLSDDLTPAYLLERAHGRALNLKALLMAQGLIAGLGNIYVCEALWRARLSPDRLARDLTPEQAEGLVAAIGSVLTEAVAAGGSSISDFAAASGELGYFQHHFCVYDRKGQPCPRPDGGIIERKIHQGRSTFFCATCQV